MSLIDPPREGVLVVEIHAEDALAVDNRALAWVSRGAPLDLLLVSEARIARAIRHAYWEERQIVEGSGAVGIAALLAGLVPAPGVTAVVVSGCNIDMTLHHRIVSGEDVDVTAD